MKTILIIIMKNNKKNYVENFTRSFDNRANLIFKMWYDKRLLSFIKKNKIDGIVLTGSNYRILKDDKKVATISKKILKLNIPIIGLCYGYQLIIKMLCGKKCLDSFKNNKNSKKKTLLKITKPFKINKSYYKFNHHDYITVVPKNWKILIQHKKQIWMAYDKEKKIMGLQFHPEATEIGKIFFKKWLKYIQLFVKY